MNTPAAIPATARTNPALIADSFIPPLFAVAVDVADATADPAEDPAATALALILALAAPSDVDAV
jgi:hypothetical protein